MKKIITIIIGALLLPNLTLAQSSDPTGEFTVHPTYKHGDNKAWIVDTVTPGDLYTDFITLKNFTDQPLTINLKVHEAEQKDTFVIKENDAYENIGNWLKLPNETYTLNPHESQKIPVQIHIPSDTQLAEYTATILASHSKVNEQNINIVTRIGVRVYLTVSNENLHASVLSINNQFSPFFLILSVLGLIGAISLNIQSFTKKQNND